MSTATLDLAMTGNCQVASLIDGNGTHVWTCMPRFDADPDLLALAEGYKEYIAKRR